MAAAAALAVPAAALALRVVPQSGFSLLMARAWRLIAGVCAWESGRA